VVITHQALSPKLGGGRHTMFWTGPHPDHPHGAYWHTDVRQAATFPTEVEAVDAFAACRLRGYELPAPQLQFITPVAVPPHVEPEQSPGQRRRARHLARIEAGQHPLSIALGPLPLHPEAARDGGRDGDGTPRCGSCRFREPLNGGSRTFPKCTYGARVVRRERWAPASRTSPVPQSYDEVVRPRVSHGEGTDVAAWWPACITYQPRTEVEGGGGG
jgi:hypothetical protein